MRFPTPLIPATLVKRYKRFLADVVLSDGTAITAHVANPGSMIGLAAPGSRVWLSKSESPTRKLPYSWELVEVDFGTGLELVGVNTAHPNPLVGAALAAGAIPGLTGYASIRREVKYGRNSRVDFLLESAARPPCYVEIKNVHLMRKPGLAEFPDARTERGAKHLEELGDAVEAGCRAVMLYLVQIGSARRFSLARDIDPRYGTAFDRARSRGVEAMALSVHDDRAVPGDRLLERPARDQQEAHALVAGLHDDLVAAIEQHERAVARCVEHGAPLVDRPVSVSTPRLRGVAERARTLEHVGEGVARRPRPAASCAAGRHRDVEIARIGGDAVDRAALPPELAADDPHVRAVVVDDLGMSATP
jgi:sugar fermentation stimulation protein A